MQVHRRFVGRIMWLALFMNSITHAATAWTAGKHYFLIDPPKVPAVAPGKVEVTEIFSYGCPACNVFLPVAHKLKRSLPGNAVLTYMPAAFNPGEDWPMFQLAFCTAQALGLVEQTHDAMFDAVWKTGELGIDPTSQRAKGHLPTLEDAARFYNSRTGVAVEKFLSTAKSFTVDVKVRSDEDAIRVYGVDRTPTIVVNGKYRVHVESAGGNDELVELVNWLVAKETG